MLHKFIEFYNYLLREVLTFFNILLYYLESIEN